MKLFRSTRQHCSSYSLINTHHAFPKRGTALVIILVVLSLQAIINANL